jgi:hypothetical protein
MARFNEILVGRFNKALTKLFSIKGAAPAPQCASEIAAIIEIDQVAIENRFLLSVDSFSVGLTNTATPAQLSLIKLRNPVGSNVIAIFEKITASAGASDFVDVQIGTDQTDGTVVAIAGAQNLDSRSGRVSSLIFSRGLAAPPPQQTTVMRAGITTTPSYDFINYQNQEIILNPGRSIQVAMTTVVNSALGVTFKWRERLLEESERQ